MQARHRGLSYRIQVVDVGSSVDIHLNAPTAVVRRGHDGDGRRAHVDAELQTAPVDIGEALDQEIARQVAHVEQDVIVTGALQLCIDGASDDVA